MNLRYKKAKALPHTQSLSLSDMTRRQVSKIDWVTDHIETREQSCHVGRHDFEGLIMVGKMACIFLDFLQVVACSTLNLNMMTGWTDGCEGGVGGPQRTILV